MASTECLNGTRRNCAYISLLPLIYVHTKVLWSMVDLRLCALGVSIASTWVHLSSYTKGDIHKSMLTWSPYSFWQFPYLGYHDPTQIRFVQMLFIVQDNFVTFLDKNTYQFRIFFSSHKFSRINPTDAKYIF